MHFEVISQFRIPTSHLFSHFGNKAYSTHVSPLNESFQKTGAVTWKIQVFKFRQPGAKINTTLIADVVPEK